MQSLPKFLIFDHFTILILGLGNEIAEVLVVFTVTVTSDADNIHKPNGTFTLGISINASHLL